MIRSTVVKLVKANRFNMRNAIFDDRDSVPYRSNSATYSIQRSPATAAREKHKK